MLLAAGACEREPQGVPRALRGPEEPPATAPAHRPVYDLPRELREQYPQISGFLIEFVNLWLSGDYEGLRSMVSRRQTPWSRERFERVFQATHKVTVTGIEPFQAPDLAAQAFRVHLHVELDPQQSPPHRPPHRDVQILVISEEGDWRLAAAPDSRSADGADQPSSSAPALPDYPWDEEDGG